MENKIVFADTDCLSCFIMIDRTDILEGLYDNITIPTYVYEEFLKAPYYIRKQIEALVKKEFIIIKALDTNEEIDLFYKFKHNIYKKEIIGNGEASALTLAKLYDGILASNNSKDVELTVKMENIHWIKAGDILEFAIDSNNYHNQRSQ